MNKVKLRISVERTMKICTAAVLALALLLTFTLSDYYIFNRISETLRIL